MPRVRADRRSGGSFLTSLCKSRSMDSMPSFDTDHLAAAVGGDDALMRKFAGDFVANARRYVADLRVICEGPEEGCDDWVHTAHKLKGAAQTVGAPRLGALAASAQSDDGSNRHMLLMALESELSAVITAVQQWRDTSG